jgi:hypothetical protein
MKWKAADFKTSPSRQVDMQRSVIVFVAWLGPRSSEIRDAASCVEPSAAPNVEIRRLRPAPLSAPLIASAAVTPCALLRHPVLYASLTSPVCTATVSPFRVACSSFHIILRVVLYECETWSPCDFETLYNGGSPRLNKYSSASHFPQWRV